MSNRVPGKHGGAPRGRPYTVDSRDYTATISPAGFDAEENVRMRVSIRAEFGHRSVCVVRGITNRSYWHDYPDVESMQAAAISITPQVVCGIIRLAREKGWDPDTSKSNFALVIDREAVRLLANSNITST